MCSPRSAFLTGAYSLNMLTLSFLLSSFDFFPSLCNGFYRIFKFLILIKLWFFWFKVSKQRALCGSNVDWHEGMVHRPQSLKIERGPFPAAPSTGRGPHHDFMLACVLQYTVYRMLECRFFHLIHPVVSLMNMRLAKGQPHISKESTIEISSQSRLYDITLLGSLWTS